MIPAIPGILLRARERLRARPDSEHEQALVRLAVGIVLFFYLLPRAFIDPGADQGAEWTFLPAMFAYLITAAAIFVHILAYPGVSPARRVLGATVDIAAVTFFMIVADDHAAPMFMVYVWITLANGFRFGVPYLVKSLALSVAGFCLVLMFSRFWGSHLEIGIGLLVGMVALALYVLTLVKRMFSALDRAETANQAKRRFISVVSHEMRTPLNAIIGMTELLRGTPLNREQADMIHTLSSSSKVLLGLVEDVLDFSKIEAGKLTLEWTDFDLHALANSTAKILAAQAEQKKLELVVSIMPEVPPALRGDAHHLRQILINLVGNAIKFTERGSVAVHVSLLEEDGNRVKLKFSVRDTGIGIPIDAQNRIFDSFAQADETTTRRFGGTGLGTTIAKQLVELMEGRIGVESAVGLGSTFWFEIQLEKQPLETASATGELADARVLVVGFPEIELRHISDALEGWGAKSLPAATVEEAGARATREISTAPRPHSALLFAQSAPLGLETLQKLRKLVHGPGIPTILVVPREEGELENASVIGGVTLLRWPFEKRLLFNALHAVSAVERDSSEVVFLSDYLKRRESARSLEILVADDNASNRTVISKILERAGHKVELVNNGEQVLDAIERRQYDLVIVDRNMPELGGIEAIKALRFIDQGRPRLPVIVLSADATPEAKEESSGAGADAFLPKPIEATRLLDVIGELCGDQPAKPKSSQNVREATPLTTSVSVLNFDTIALLEELGSQSDFMEKLIEGFLADNQQILRRLEYDADRMPAAEIRALLHAMKGSVSSVGADRLTQICTRISRLSDGDLRAQSGKLVRTIRDEFDAVRNSLAEYLSKTKRTTG